MSETPRQDGRFAWLRGLGSWSPLGLAIETGLLLRVVAAVLVERRVGLGPRVCLFPDSEYYWKLAQTIRDGELFQIVEWGDIPHFALRTPGYPIFLAGCRWIAGDRPLGARLVQAALGALAVWLAHRLTLAVFADETNSQTDPIFGRAALIAAILTAVHPYFVFTSVLLLSEAVFVPLMLVSLWAGAVLWNGRGGRRAALVLGLSSGAAVLARPSWLLFPPLMLGLWLAKRVVDWRAGGVSPLSGPTVMDKRRQGAHAPRSPGLALIAVVGFVVVMGPWWVRNARVYGQFVPTALWMGASLYDGLNPDATGASDMRFLADPEIWPLDERDQDEELKRRAIQFVRVEPVRALKLAAVKLGRYWSPWPNADGPRSKLVAAAALGLVMVPLLGLIALGLWLCRDRPPAWVFLAGPLIYFCCIHMIFASSMRYRLPAEAPAMGLAAVGMARVVQRSSRAGIGRAGGVSPLSAGGGVEKAGG